MFRVLSLFGSNPDNPLKHPSIEYAVLSLLLINIALMIYLAYKLYKLVRSNPWTYFVMSVYLDIFIGNREKHAREITAYNSTCSLLSKNAKIYGLSSIPEELSEEEQEILRELDVNLRTRLIIVSDLE